MKIFNKLLMLMTSISFSTSIFAVSVEFINNDAASYSFTINDASGNELLVLPQATKKGAKTTSDEISLPLSTDKAYQIQILATKDGEDVKDTAVYNLSLPRLDQIAQKQKIWAQSGYKTESKKPALKVNYYRANPLHGGYTLSENNFIKAEFVHTFKNQ